MPWNWPEFSLPSAALPQPLPHHGLARRPGLPLAGLKAKARSSAFPPVRRLRGHRPGSRPPAARRTGCISAESRHGQRAGQGCLPGGGQRRSEPGHGKRLYALGDQRQKDIAAALGVSPSTVSEWLARTIKEEKEQKRAKAYAMWLACATQQEIAEAVDVHVDTASEWSKGFSENTAAEFSENWRDFDPPIYNVWKQQTKTNAVGHFGNSEARDRGDLLVAGGLVAGDADLRKCGRRDKRCRAGRRRLVPPFARRTLRLLRIPKRLSHPPLSPDAPTPAPTAVAREAPGARPPASAAVLSRRPNTGRGSCGPS